MGKEGEEEEGIKEWKEKKEEDIELAEGKAKGTAEEEVAEKKQAEREI